MTLKSINEWRAATTETATVEPQDAEVLLDVIDQVSAINSYTVKEWTAIDGVGKTLAKRLIAEAPFANVDDLKHIKGVGKKVFDSIKEHLSQIS